MPSEWDVVAEKPIGEWDVVATQPVASESFGVGGGFKSDPYRRLKQYASDIYTPALQMGGAIKGGLLGATAGSLVPFAGTVTGGATGGTIGYMAGDKAARGLDILLGIEESGSISEELRSLIGSAKTGATYETGGPIATKAVVGGVKGMWKVAEKIGLADLLKRIKKALPKLSDRQIIKKAQEELADIRSEGMGQVPQQTEELLKRTGVKTQPTYAQKTGSTRAASYEQKISATDSEVKAILTQQDAQINEEVLGHIEKQFAAGSSIDDVIKSVEKLKGGLEAEAATAAKTAEKAVGLGGKTTQAVGMETREVLKAGKKVAKAKVDKLYAKIPKDIRLDPTSVTTAVKGVVADFKKKGGKSDTFPGKIVGQILKATKAKKGVEAPTKITFEKLQDWRSQVSQELRDTYRSVDPNLKLARRLQMLQDGIDEAMDGMLKLGGKHPEAVKAYRVAKDFFVKKYIPAFRSGTVADVLRQGKQAMGGKIAYSDIPARFFRAGKMDAADDLVRAVGQKKSGELIKDYAVQDLYSRSKATTGIFSSVKAGTWLAKNKTILDKFGLYDDINNMVQKNVVADRVAAKVVEYNKTAASVILEKDVDKIVGEIFKGKGKAASAKTALDLLRTPGIQGNRAAIDGIKNSFKDHLLKKMEISGVDVLQNPIRTIAKAKTVLEELGPAMRVLYKDNPRQAQAFMDYHKILEMLGRNKNVTYAGGSTTAEKLARSEKSIIGNAMQFIAVSVGKGWKWSATKNMVGSFLGRPGKHAGGKAEALLKEAIYNPEAAEVIMSVATGKIKGKGIDEMLKIRAMVAAGYVAGGAKKDLEGLQ